MASMRSISRVVGVSINTVTKLLVDAGETCLDRHDQLVTHVQAKRTIPTLAASTPKKAEVFVGTGPHASSLVDDTGASLEESIRPLGP